MVSTRECRLSVTNPAFRELYRNVLWLEHKDGKKYLFRVTANTKPCYRVSRLGENQLNWQTMVKIEQKIFDKYAKETDLINKYKQDPLLICKLIDYQKKLKK